MRRVRGGRRLGWDSGVRQRRRPPWAASQGILQFSHSLLRCRCRHCLPYCCCCCSLQQFDSAELSRLPLSLQTLHLDVYITVPLVLPAALRLQELIVSAYHILVDWQQLCSQASALKDWVGRVSGHAAACALFICMRVRRLQRAGSWLHSRLSLTLLLLLLLLLQVENYLSIETPYFDVLHKRAEPGEGEGEDGAAAAVEALPSLYDETAKGFM